MIFDKRVINAVLVTLFLLFTVIAVNAIDQTRLMKADDAFSRGEYVEAIDLYRIAYIMDNIDTSEKQELCKKCASVQDKARYLDSIADKNHALEQYRLLVSLNPNDKEANEYLKSYCSSSDTYSTRNVEIVKTSDGAQILCYVDPNLEEMTYRDAVEFCNRLNVGGEVGWRLPTMDELMLYYCDFPSQKGIWIWVGYKGVLINEKQPDYYERNTNMRYDPCINGESLLVHPYCVNSRGEYVSGNIVRHKFIPVKKK